MVFHQKTAFCLFYRIFRIKNDTKLSLEKRKKQVFRNKEKVDTLTQPTKTHIKKRANEQDRKPGHPCFNRVYASPNTVRGTIRYLSEEGRLIDLIL